jgi:transcriptional regulator with XRE-family HTH domain
MATQKIDPRKADSTDVEVGRLVRALRMSRGLTQTDLANRIGVTFQQVQKYENGGNRISMGRLTNIAKLFKVSVPYLLDGGKQAATLKSSVKHGSEYTEALEMLGRIGRPDRFHATVRGRTQQGVDVPRRATRRRKDTSHEAEETRVISAG